MCNGGVVLVSVQISIHLFLMDYLGLINLTGLVPIAFILITDFTFFGGLIFIGQIFAVSSTV